MSLAVYDPDEMMQSCVNRAMELYQADNVLSHETIAYALGDFLADRLHEQPDTADRAALLSVVRHLVRVATYLSNGRVPIVTAMASLIRLALPWADHFEYRPEWRPVEHTRRSP